MNKFSFKTNINCNNCVQSVTPFLNELDNVEFWKVDTENPDKILEVTIDDDDIQSVVEAVQNAGYTIKPS